MRVQITVGQLALDLQYGPPAATENHQRPKNTHIDECRPYDGPERRWREKATSITWTELGIDHISLSWPTPMCGTSYCLTPEHLAWEAPKKLEYPAGVCVYCGLIAGTNDHLLPRTWTGDAIRKNVLVVPACGECNSVISDRYAPSVNERRKIAQQFIRRRHHRILHMPEWSSSDIAELGPTLRSTIELGIHNKRITKARLAWPEDPDYDLRVMQLSGIENPHEIGLLS